MSNLILPPSAKPLRPYASVPTNALLMELQERGLIKELTVQGPMPTELPEGADLEAIRTQIFAQAFQQLGAALPQTEFAFTGSGHLPPDTREILVVKLMVVRHPLRP